MFLSGNVTLKSNLGLNRIGTLEQKQKLGSCQRTASVRGNLAILADQEFCYSFPVGSGRRT
jgi:hypothetical protein